MTVASTAATTAIAASNGSSSYRVNFKREHLLELVETANLRAIYHGGRIPAFSRRIRDVYLRM